jgi:hypothetical protein
MKPFATFAAALLLGTGVTLASPILFRDPDHDALPA